MSMHTKTPWRAGRGCVVADVPVPGMGGSDAVEYYGGHLVAESITAENVEFIVRACNSYDELVEALTMVRDADNDCRADGLPTIPAPARAKIDAALATAGVK